jgi:hypothetical protein
MARLHPPRSRQSRGPELRVRRNRAGRSTSPEPLLNGKHVENPPIVTIFGAGIAGLTAAHELVERGFYVQVVEKVNDPYQPGSPIVGGMAANQPARARPNMIDAHESLSDIAMNSTDGTQKGVANWLLTVFAFNRASWIQTEDPADLPRQIRWTPAEREREAEDFLTKLAAARLRHKEQWVWDLVFRGVLLQTTNDVSAPEANKTSLEQRALDLHNRLMGQEGVEFALTILKLERDAPAGFQAPNLPKREHLETYAGLVEAALNREFLCFRFLPSSDRRTVPEAATKRATELLSAWLEALKGTVIEHCCLDTSPARGQLVGPGPVEQFDKEVAELEKEGAAWLELDVIELRLPGEHGFRFFPAFYRHLEDTLKRIPLPAGREAIGRTVYDNLRPTIRQGIGLSGEDLRRIRREGGKPVARENDPSPCDDAPDRRNGGTIVEILRERPTSIEGLRDRTDRFVKRLGGTNKDALLLFAKLLRFMTSSPERRKARYEDISWAQFLGITNKRGKPVKPQKFSRPMVHHIQSAAQALLAFNANEADARSYGNVAVQMFLDGGTDGRDIDRILTGPTSETWLDPWRRYLESEGVRFFKGELKSIQVVGDELLPVFENRPPGDGFLYDDLDPTGERKERVDPSRRPDFYVLALNVEEANRVIEGVAAQDGDRFLDLVKSTNRVRAPDFESRGGRGGGPPPANHD